mgnify:CR=1 FL=1
MERFVRMMDVFFAGQAVSLRAGSWEAVPMNCGWLEACARAGDRGLERAAEGLVPVGPMPLGRGPSSRIS